MALRKQLVQTLVWSVFSDEREIWNLGVNEQKMIQVFELWYYERMLKIPKIDRLIDRFERFQRGSHTENFYSVASAEANKK